MNEWQIAAAVLGAAIVPCLGVCVLGSATHGAVIALPTAPHGHVSADDYVYGFAATLGALGLAGLGLFGRPLRVWLPARVRRPGEVAVEAVRGLHSGHIGDYIAWRSGGVSLLGGVGLLGAAMRAAALATSRMSVACGYVEELTAFGPRHSPGLAAIESIAGSGARKLGGVFGHDQSDIYQGESVGAVVHDSSSLLAGCGLTGARATLERALSQRGAR